MSKSIDSPTISIHESDGILLPEQSTWLPEALLILKDINGAISSPHRLPQFNRLPLIGAAESITQVLGIMRRWLNLKFFDRKGNLRNGRIVELYTDYLYNFYAAGFLQFFGFPPYPQDNQWRFSVAILDEPRFFSTTTDEETSARLQAFRETLGDEFIRQWLNIPGGLKRNQWKEIVEQTTISAEAYYSSKS